MQSNFDKTGPRRADTVKVWVAQDVDATAHEACAKPRGIDITLELLKPFPYRCYICGKPIGLTTK